MTKIGKFIDRNQKFLKKNRDYRTEIFEFDLLDAAFDPRCHTTTFRRGSCNPDPPSDSNSATQPPQSERNPKISSL